MPAACRISHTVDGATVRPSLVSSPWIRRYPHSGFSVARRMTRRAVLETVGGRPGLRRVLASYFLAASLRCQASSVAGVTGKTPVQRLRGMSRASAANHAGRPTRTVSARHCGAAPRSRAGAQAAQRPSPGRHGTPGQLGRVPSASVQVDDLRQHPASQPSLRPVKVATASVISHFSIRAAQGPPSRSRSRGVPG
jgi:hypothetical protein